MLGAAVFFTGMALCVGTAHRLDPGLSTFVSSSWRAVVNLLALVVMARGDRQLLWGDGRWELWARGFSGSAALMSYFAALPLVGVGEAAFLNQTSALWVALLAPFLLGERTRPLVWAAIAGSMVGVALLAHPREATAVVAGMSNDTLGRGLGLASGLFAAAAYLAIRRAATSNPAITVVFYFTLLSTFLAVGLALATGAAWPTDPAVLASLAGAGLCATIAQILMTDAYRLAPAALMSATSAAGPLLTALAGWFFLAELPDAEGQVGMAILVVTSVVLPLISR